MRLFDEYKVVKDTNTEHLVNSVNNLLSIGWEPLGGMQFSPLQSGGFYCFQTLIMRKTEKNLAREYVKQ